jgi:hypothetical protein
MYFVEYMWRIKNQQQQKHMESIFSAHSLICFAFALAVVIEWNNGKEAGGIKREGISRYH